jgi:hypothetical protein
LSPKRGIRNQPIASKINKNIKKSDSPRSFTLLEDKESYQNFDEKSILAISTLKFSKFTTSKPQTTSFQNRKKVRLPKSNQSSVKTTPLKTRPV